VKTVVNSERHWKFLVTVTKMASDIHYLPQYSLLIFTVHAYVLLIKLHSGSPHDVVHICLVLELMTALLEYLDLFDRFCASSDRRCFFTNFSMILHDKYVTSD